MSQEMRRMRYPEAQKAPLRFGATPEPRALACAIPWMLGSCRIAKRGRAGRFGRYRHQAFGPFAAGMTMLLYLVAAVRAGEPAAYREIARASLFSTQCTWSPPALSRGLLFVPQNDRDLRAKTPARLLCYDLRGSVRSSLEHRDAHSRLDAGRDCEGR